MADQSLPNGTVVGSGGCCSTCERALGDTRAKVSCSAATRERGAVFVEFLIAFLPVYLFFLGLLQLTIVYSAKLVTEHAATNAARAAAVVMGDNPARYRDQNSAKHRMTVSGERRKVIRKAAILSLAPLILDGLIQQVDVVYPRPDQPGGEGQTGDITFAPMNGGTVSKVRVRVEVVVVCRFGLINRIVCRGRTPTVGISRSQGSGFFFMATQKIRAEAVYPYQGARYDYK